MLRSQPTPGYVANRRSVCLASRSCGYCVHPRVPHNKGLDDNTSTTTAPDKENSSTNGESFIAEDPRESGIGE